MNKLIHFEFHKLKKQKSFYICTVIMIGLVFLSTVTSKVMSTNAGATAQYNYSGINSMLNAISNSSFLIIVGIFAALLICDDYEQQTIKNIFSRGYSRNQVYFGKLVTVWVASTMMFILVVLSAFAFGSIYFGSGNFEGYDIIGKIAIQYVASMANVSLFFAICTILHKTGSSIAAIIVAPMIVNMILSLADSLLKLNNFSATSFWISSFIGDLSTLTTSSGRITVCLVASLIYIPLFVAVGLFFNKKAEL